MSHSRIVIKWFWFVGGAILLAFLSLVVLLPDNMAASSARGVSAQLPSGIPVRIKIPAIRVDATVLSLGLATDGAMAVPSGPLETAWYDLGPKPGDNGAAVIAGHFGWKDNIPAVFDNLTMLQPGDKILVENDKGETMTFVVRELRTFDGNGNAASVFSSTDGKAHLNLITCEGVWNKDSKSYSKRLVVFTDAV